MLAFLSHKFNVSRGNAHRRITEQLLEYWLERKPKQDPFPSEMDIDPKAIKSIWDSCFIIKVEDDEPSHGFKYSYLGASLIDAYGEDLSQHDIPRTLLDPGQSVLAKQFEKVIRLGLPASEDGEFTNHNNELIKYRCCMLPLGSPDGTVKTIIGGMKWKTP